MQRTNLLSKSIKAISSFTSSLLAFSGHVRQDEIMEINNALHRHFHTMLSHQLQTTDKEPVLQITSIMHNAHSSVNIHFYFEPQYAKDIKFSTSSIGSMSTTRIILSFKRGSVKLYKQQRSIPEWVHEIQLENLEGMSVKDISDFRIAYKKLVKSYGGNINK